MWVCFGAVAVTFLLVCKQEVRECFRQHFIEEDEQ